MILVSRSTRTVVTSVHLVVVNETTNQNRRILAQVSVRKSTIGVDEFLLNWSVWFLTVLAGELKIGGISRATEQDFFAIDILLNLKQSCKFTTTLSSDFYHSLYVAEHSRAGTQ